MTILQTIILAVIQGITELFPISSVAHAVLTPFLFGWPLSPEFLKTHFLPFVVMLHLGTAVALLIYFWRDWADFGLSLMDSRAGKARAELTRVAVGTLPALILGLALEKVIKAHFSSVRLAAVFLIVNGLVLFFGERARARGTKEIENLGYLDAFLIGLAQSLALIPGFSRSGASMVAGFWAGLSHGASARFSMLLATPIILGASALELPKLAHAGKDLFEAAAIGGAVAGVVALISVWALMRWFRRHEVNAMLPFAIYCWALGAVVLALSI